MLPRLHLRPLTTFAFAPAFPNTLARASRVPPLVAPTPQLSRVQCAHGTQIATVDDHGPVSALVLRLPCGSRLETCTSAGVAHFLKHFLFSYTENQSPIQLAREIDLRSVKLQVCLDREHLDFRAKFERPDLDFVVRLIADVVQHTKFNHWEFDLARTKVAEEATQVWSHPARAAFETAHALAFRDGGLAHCPVALACAQGNVAVHDVRAFAQTHLRLGPRARWAAVGVDVETLRAACETHFEAPAPGTPAGASVAASVVRGTAIESRIDLPGPHSNVTLAFPLATGAGTAARTPAEIAARRALAVWLHAHPHVKWGAPKPGAPLAAVATEYTDAALFALTATHTCPATCTRAVQHGIDGLRDLLAGSAGAPRTPSPAVSLAHAIRHAHFEMLESPLLARATHLASSHADLTAVLAAFETLTERDVVKAAQGIAKCKPVLVVAGKVHALPFLDTFKLF